jgi:hypothetical protein
MRSLSYLRRNSWAILSNFEKLFRGRWKELGFDTFLLGFFVLKRDLKVHLDPHEDHTVREAVLVLILANPIRKLTIRNAIDVFVTIGSYTSRSVPKVVASL